MDIYIAKVMSTAAGAVLYNDEILRNIILYIHGPADLARCARLSRSFSDPALDALWKRLDNMVFLFRVLNLKEVSDADYDTAFPRTIYALATKAEDIPCAIWSRFDFYARRVRSLRIHLQPYPVHQSIWDAVVHHIERNKTLFTRLTSFTWEAHDRLLWEELCFTSALAARARGAHNIQLIIGTSFIASIKGRKKDYFGKFVPLLKSWTRGSLSLKELTFFSVYPITTLSFLRGCDALESVSLGPISVAKVISRCSSLPLLSSLTVKFRAKQTSAAVPQGLPNAQSFNSLRSLGMFCGSTEDVITLCRAVSSKHLESLNISNHDTTVLNGLTMCLAVVFPMLSASLSTVRIKQTSLRRANNLPVFGGFVSPFLYLHRLQTLELELLRAEREAFSQFTDHDMLVMAKAWPKIESLSLSFRCTQSEVPSRASLLYFGQNCPHLHTLVLLCGPLRATVNDMALHDPGNPSGHPLKTLCLQWEHDDVDDARQYARFLLSNYPSLQLLRSQRGLGYRMSYALQGVETEMRS